MDFPTYMQTAICTQRTEVLVLEMKHYERLLVKRNPKSIENMKSGLDIKLKTRLSQLLVRHVPIFETLVHMVEDFQIQMKQQKTARIQDKNKEARSSKKLSESFDSFIPPRGALVDLYGAGTVFHRIRERDQARKKRKMQKSGRFASKGGVPPATPQSDQSPPGKQGMFPPPGNGMIRNQHQDPVLTDLENRMRAWLNNDCKFPSTSSSSASQSARSEVNIGGEIKWGDI